jgi:hypothetical protein
MTIILPEVVSTQPQIFPKFHEEYVSLFVHSRLFLQDSMHDAVTPKCSVFTDRK